MPTVISQIEPSAIDQVRSVSGKPAPDEPVEQAIRAILADGAHWFGVNRVLAIDGNIRGVHQFRATTRRLRSALALFGGLIEESWSSSLAEDLKWIAGKLGELRDVDVKTERLRSSAGKFVQAEFFSPLFEGFVTERTQKAEALFQSLESERFQMLAERLETAASKVPLSDDVWQPCREILPRLVAESWKAFRRAGHSLTPAALDEEFHKTRKRAKQARYAAEAVTISLDSEDVRSATLFARRIKAVQDVLGIHQDAVLAAQELKRAASHHAESRLNFEAGRLYEREQATAVEARFAFFQIWRELDRKKLKRWLKP